MSWGLIPFLLLSTNVHYPVLTHLLKIQYIATQDNKHGKTLHTAIILTVQAYTQYQPPTDSIKAKSVLLFDTNL
jgi:hypothetical protein